MEVVIASERARSTPSRLLVASSTSAASLAVVVAALILIGRWAAGAIDGRSMGGGIAVAAAGIVLASAVAVTVRPGIVRWRHRRASDRAGWAPIRETNASKDDGVRHAPIAPAAAAPPWPDAKLVQRIERYERQEQDGPPVETAIGRVVVRFPAGMRSAVAHVGFCPPFPTTPRVAVSTDCDGLEVDVAAVELLPWGMRIECRLEGPAEEPIDVEVDLVAEPGEHQS